MKLADRVTLVTGASRGIGRGCALEMAREGADVVVNYRSHPEEAAEVIAEIRGLGRQAIAFGADVGDRAAPRIEQVRRRQPTHAFVVGQHAMAFHRRMIVTIDHHNRGAVLHQVLQDVGIAGSVRRGHDDAVDLTAVEHFELRALLAWILTRTA